jgi:hypothetical protein
MYDISEIFGLNVVPLTVSCNVKDLLFNNRVSQTINDLMLNSNNIVIQELKTNQLVISPKLRLVELPYYRHASKLDMISFQKALIFNIIVGKKASHMINSIVGENYNIYEVDNYNIGNKSTNTWLFELKEYESMEINHDIKNNIIYSGEKLESLLKTYGFSYYLVRNIKENYDKLRNIFISKEIVKDLQDFYYIKETLTNESRYDYY